MLKVPWCGLVSPWRGAGQILERRTSAATGGVEYLVQWHGYGLDACTWEPPENCSGCKAEIDALEREEAEAGQLEAAAPGCGRRRGAQSGGGGRPGPLNLVAARAIPNPRGTNAFIGAFSLSLATARSPADMQSRSQRRTWR